MSARTNVADSVTDPEGIEALNAIDEFENRCAKKPNRYPKASLETHLNLNETMKDKISKRTQFT